MKTKILLVLALFTTTLFFSQVGINTTNPQAALDISAGVTPSNTDGILIPRVDEYPTGMTSAQDGMLVFITGAGVPTKGFYYYNDGVGWSPIIGPTGTANTLDQAYNEGGLGAGKNITANDGAVRINGEDGFLVTGTRTNGNLMDIEITGAGTRMFFNPNQAAFRAGEVDGTQWNSANIGTRSVAFGNNTIASNLNTTAFGDGASATGLRATAFGSNTLASGPDATAFGRDNISSNSYAITFGLSNLASGSTSMAFGQSTTASGIRSLSFGQSTTASGVDATAFGQVNTATADRSTAWGFRSNAIANDATVSGVYNTAASYGETVIGLYASNYSPISTNSFNSSDRIFTVGNGTGVANNFRSNALTIYKSGLLNINDEYNMPLVDGTIGQVMTTDGVGNITFEDASGTDADFYETGTSNAPDNINDNVYTLGNLNIGSSSASTDRVYIANPVDENNAGIRLVSTGDDTGNIGYGFYNQSSIGDVLRFSNYYNSIAGSSDATLRMIENQFSNTGSGTKTGLYNEFNFNSQEGGKIGVVNRFEGGDTFATGMINEAPGAWSVNSTLTGVQNSLDAGGNGVRYGTRNSINGLGSGAKYGSHNSIGNTAGGTHYGVYSDVRKANSYAGFFIGRMSLGTDGVLNRYLMPSADGTAGQVMTTNGTGNVTFTTLPSSDDADWLRITDNMPASLNTDNIYTTGSVSIGTAGTSGDFTILHNEPSDGAQDILQFNSVSNSGSDNKIIIENTFGSATSGNNTAISNQLIGNGSGRYIGLRNNSYANVTGDVYGVDNSISANGNGEHYGINTILSGVGAGTKYGSYTRINSGAGGTHYGFYSDVQNASGYAGYFIGRTSLGAGPTSRYLMPATDGTAGQVITTDGAGQLSFSTSSGDADWTISGNDIYSTNSGNVGIGDTTPDYKLDLEYSGTLDRAFNIDFTGTAGSGIAQGLNITAQSNTTGFVNGAIVEVINSNASSQTTALSGINSSGANNKYGVSGRAAGSGLQNIGVVGSADFATTNYGGYFSANSPTATTNYGIVAVAEDASGSNWAGYFGDASTDSGNVFVNDYLRVDGELAIDPTGTGYSFPTVDGAAGQVMTTDGAGQVSFSALTTGAERIDDLIDGKSDNDGSEDGSSIFFGVNAGQVDNGSNNQNVGIGYNALQANTSGDINVGIGHSVLYNNVSGSFNTAIGYYALYGNNSGDSNVAIGRDALVFNSSGNENVAIGSGAGLTNILGDGNVYIGNNAGQSHSGSNTLWIDNSDADQNNALIYGEFDNDILRTNAELQIGNPTGTGYAFPTADGTANYVMRTNGLGQLSFIDPTTFGDGDTQNTLDQAYDEGGPGAGRTITANDGAVTIAGQDGFTVTGTINNGDFIAATGAGTRMFFNPNKASFRAGTVDGTQWDNVNLGSNSVAFGTNNIASGGASTSLGSGNTSSGTASLTAGSASTASGGNSVALNENNTASGLNSFAQGFGNTSSASSSTAMGIQNTSPSWGEMVVGSFARTYAANSTVGWNMNDRVFTVGNGTATSARSNALTIYKDGEVNINDAYSLPTADGTIGQVMSTDGAGNITFQNVVGDGTGTDNQTIDTFSFNTATNILTLEIEDDGVAAQTVDLSTLNPVKSLARITLNADQVVTGSGTTKVNFDTEDFDINNDFNTTTDVFTAPANGIYRVTSQITIDSSIGTGVFSIRVRVDGSQVRRTEFNHSGNGLVVRQVTSMLNLTMGQTIDVAFSRPGVGATILSNSGGSFFEIEQVR